MKAEIFILLIAAPAIVSMTGNHKADKIDDPKAEITHPADAYFDRLKLAESSKRHTSNGKVKISKDGAIGIAQVLPQTLEYYNSINGTDYSVKALYDQSTNELVGLWYFRRCYDLSRSNVVLAANRYHQGHNASRYRIRYVYVCQICPDEYERFMKGKRIIKADEKYIMWTR